MSLILSQNMSNIQLHMCMQFPDLKSLALSQAHGSIIQLFNYSIYIYSMYI